MGRRAEIRRQTKETDIRVSLELEGRGLARVSTGLGFFDHMLTLLAFHGFFDLEVEAQGDLAVDGHHTVEDVGICLGRALSQALGERGDLVRYGQSLLPMDESLVQVAVDLSNRPFSQVVTPRAIGPAGGFDGQLAAEFFRALAIHGGLTLHVLFLHGENDHHLLEAAFKALGRALDQATSREARPRASSSTKGVL